MKCPYGANLVFALLSRISNLAAYAEIMREPEKCRSGYCRNCIQLSRQAYFNMLQHVSPLQSGDSCWAGFPGVTLRSTPRGSASGFRFMGLQPALHRDTEKAQLQCWDSFESPFHCGLNMP